MVLRAQFLSFTLALLLAVPLWGQSSAQPLGQGQDQGAVQQACYQGGHFGIGHHPRPVWGMYSPDPCGRPHGLFPPCPNPCRPTLLGELVRDVKYAVDGSVRHVLCFALGGCRLCGACCDTCGELSNGCDCDGGVYDVESTFVPQPATPTDLSDPFQDEQVQGTGVSAKVGRSGARTQTAATAPRTGQAVQRASHEQPVVGRVAATRSKGVRHQSILRRANGTLLRASGQQ